MLHGLTADVVGLLFYRITLGTGENMKIIDTHCHIYPDKIAEKATAATGTFYNMTPRLDGRVETLLSEGKKAGIEKYIVNSVATTPEQVHAINSYISSTVNEKLGVFIGMGTLHPESGDIEADVNEIISLGLVGVKLHPDIQRFKTDSKKAMEIFELVQGRLPVCIHMGDSRYSYSNPQNIIPVLKAFPRLTVIGAHLGGWSLWEYAAKELSGYENLLVDCSSSLYALDPASAKKIIMKYGTSRVMFGSDFPMWNPYEEVGRFMQLDFSEKEREDILYKNAARLFNINFN